MPGGIQDGRSRLIDELAEAHVGLESQIGQEITGARVLRVVPRIVPGGAGQELSNSRGRRSGRSLQGEAPLACGEGLPPEAPHGRYCLLLRSEQLGPSCCLRKPQGRAGHLAEVAPRAVTLQLEGILLTRCLGDPGNGKVSPRILSDPTQLNVTRGKEELVQEPVDSIDVIARPRCLLPEGRVLDQRPGRTPGVELCRDTATQIIDLPRVVTRNPPPARHAEQCVPDLPAVHGRSITAGPGPRR